KLLKINTKQHNFTKLKVLKNNKLISKNQNTKYKPQKKKNITLKKKQQKTHASNLPQYPYNQKQNTLKI
ncbi:hypothetical protein, partial [Stenotrophomonas maltophilia]|uniref:hypothetical protein n=1 Tax=Stenotrophomonas maltophilia TaxID=40324 RepID=UPI00313DF4E7